MGLRNGTDAKTVYVKVKNGKFYLATDKELTSPYSELFGIVTDMYLKDEEYMNISSRKFYIVLEDEGERYIIGFNIESSYTSSILTFLMNADLSKPLTLHPREKNEIGKDGKEKLRRSILISQEGKFLKAYFTRETPNGLPEMQKIERRGGKIEWNKDAVLDFYEDLILNRLRPKVEGNKAKVSSVPHVQAVSSGDSVKPEPTVKTPWDDEDDVTEDLPF